MFLSNLRILEENFRRNTVAIISVLVYNFFMKKSIIILILVGICQVYSAEQDITRITISAIGDIMAHIDMQDYALLQSNTFVSLYKDVAELFEYDDLTIGNLETPVSDKLPVRGYPTFNAPSSFISSLKAVGVDLLTTANNHSIDQGSSGIVDTIEVLKKHEIPFSGTGLNIEDSYRFIFLNIHGIRIGFLGITCLTNIPQPKETGVPTFNFVPYWVQADYDKLVAKINEARTQADLIILAIHEGEEYKSFPRKATETLYEKLCEVGVDVILGHHPHVLQRIEMRELKDGRRGLIAYSLGNFISAQARYAPYLEKGDNSVYDNWLSKTAEGVVLRFDVVKQGDRITVADPRVVPFFNVCFRAEENKKHNTGYQINFFDVILDRNNAQRLPFAKNYEIIRKLAEYRLTKLKELIGVRLSDKKSEIETRAAKKI